MRQVSLKRELENRKRRRVIAELYAESPWCARCGRASLMLDGHELLSRARGGSITNPDNIVLLCRPCHSHITTHPDVAELEGWALSRRAS